MSKVDDSERSKGTFCVGVNWEKYSKKDLCEIARVSFCAFTERKAGSLRKGLLYLVYWGTSFG